ncbi:MAG: UDP-N-acetylglucosamine--N-acetylmuramyl-(pentapeptide) pyrophosphoryl-undecaprenol, partial [Burkholderiales bacterium]|nr:UDP-N-acetylglucosamine--N-acetylmuramyl-(pentapeptide) pyrophosphoryl-undecaprenol [Burkholderiales bacterium]
VAKLCETQYDILWVGAKGGIESTVVPRYGIPISSINISGLRKKGFLRLLLMPFLLLRAFFQSFIIILRERPDVIVGFGGYVTFPVCFMGVILRIPVIIHEQNSVPGLSNKILARFVNKVIVAFPRVLASKKTILLGNPVRKDIDDIPGPEIRYAARSGGLNILILGGSLGAKIFNDILPEVFGIINNNQAGHIANITHQVGKGDLETVASQYQNFGVNNITVINFIDDMAMMYANIDLVICRAGASTVSEICAVGLAAIFVPYPYAVDDHQKYNALNLVKTGASIMFDQSSLSAAKLADTIIALNRPKCKDMAQLTKELAIKDSSEKIKQVITSFIT